MRHHMLAIAPLLLLAACAVDEIDPAASESDDVALRDFHPGDNFPSPPCFLVPGDEPASNWAGRWDSEDGSVHVGMGLDLQGNISATVTERYGNRTLTTRATQLTNSGLRGYRGEIWTVRSGLHVAGGTARPIAKVCPKIAAAAAADFDAVDQIAVFSSNLFGGPSIGTLAAYRETSLFLADGPRRLRYVRYDGQQPMYDVVLIPAP